LRDGELRFFDLDHPVRIVFSFPVNGRFQVHIPLISITWTFALSDTRVAKRKPMEGRETAPGQRPARAPAA